MPSNRAPEFEGVLILFLALCSIAFVLRCYCRIAIVKSFGLDDYFAGISMGLFIIFCVFALNGVAHGTGRSFSLISTEDFPIGMMWWWSCEPVYVLTNMALKQSIAIFLLRIAVDRTQRFILYAALIVSQLYSAYFFFLFVFQCTPISNFWNQYRGGVGHCINPSITVASFYGYSAISCATDWTFSIVPIFMVWNLQMDRKTKISVAFMLAFAAIASTATIVRLPYIRGLEDTGDFLYATIDVAIWSTCETGLGLATSSIATLRPLLKQMKLGSFGDSSVKSTNRWNRSHARTGYIRKSSKKGDKDIQLRQDMNKHTGITTVVAAGGKAGAALDEHYNNIGAYRELSRSGSVTALKDTRGWNHTSEHKSTDGDSEEYVPSQTDFDHGIRKTVQVSQV